MKSYKQIMGCLFLLMLLTGCQAGKSSYEKGMEQYHSYQYSEALRLLKQAVNQNDSVPDYYVGLGMAQIHMGETDEALESFQRALELDEKNRQAMRGLGIAYYSIGEYELAVNNFELALKETDSLLTNLDIDILRYLADSQMLAGMYEAAYQSYEQLIQLDVDIVQNLLYQMENRFLIGEIEQGLDNLAAAIQLDPHNYNIYIEAYRILDECNYPSQGERVLQQALTLDVNSEEDYLGRGNIYYLLGDLEHAMEDFNTSYEMGNNDAGMYMIRCYVELNQYEEAESMWETYKQSEENHNAKVYYQMSLVKMKMGEYEDAKQLIAQALSLDDGTWTQNLKWNEAILYEYMHDYTTAYEKLNAYGQIYGYSADVQKEMDFVKTR